MMLILPTRKGYFERENFSHPTRVFFVPAELFQARAHFQFITELSLSLQGKKLGRKPSLILYICMYVHGTTSIIALCKAKFQGSALLVGMCLLHINYGVHLVHASSVMEGNMAMTKKAISQSRRDCTVLLVVGRLPRYDRQGHIVHSVPHQATSNNKPWA